jgi:hypothetical protein
MASCMAAEQWWPCMVSAVHSVLLHAQDLFLFYPGEREGPDSSIGGALRGPALLHLRWHARPGSCSSSSIAGPGYFSSGGISHDPSRSSSNAWHTGLALFSIACRGSAFGHALRASLSYGCGVNTLPH